MLSLSSILQVTKCQDLLVQFGGAPVHNPFDWQVLFISPHNTKPVLQMWVTTEPNVVDGPITSPSFGVGGELQLTAK